MRPLLPWVMAALPLALAGGCDANVLVYPRSDGGVGGAGGAGMATATASTGTGASNGCGGEVGLLCPSNDFCKWVPSGSCGHAGGTGVCEPRPGGCPADCPGVCGCDGQFYCNACTANAAGVDVDVDVSCAMVDAGPPPSPAHYLAWAIPTNLPRFAIAKIEPSADICIVLVLAKHDGPSAALVIPPGWSVEQSWVQQDGAACESMIGTFPLPPAQAVMSSGGGGTIEYDNLTGVPCSIAINAAQTFPQDAPWAPAWDLLQVSPLPVAGCGG